MSDVLNRIAELEQQRAQLNGDIDRQIEGLKEQALAELEAMRSQLSKYETALSLDRKFRTPVPTLPTRATRTELDETDAGNGIRETQDNVSAPTFKDELASLRERTQEKRRRLG